MFDELVLDERVVCIWSKGLTGKSEGFDKTLPEKTQHWFGTEAPEAAPAFAVWHESQGKTARDYYRELAIGDAIAVSEEAEGIDKAESLVGYGTFGVVRAAQHKPSGTEVVLKIVGLEDAGQSYYCKMVEKDGCNLSMAGQHPNVVKMLDFMLTSRNLFCAMQPLRGQELDDFVAARYPVSEALMQIIVRQMVSALQYIHSVSVMHRDIKNDSFRFQRNDPDDPGKLVLFDFGLSLETRLPVREILGTVPYMAPEVSSRDYGLPVDMWSLGVVLFTMMTGDFPFELRPMETFKVGQGERERALAAEELSGQPREALDFLAGLLTVNACERLTAEQAIRHAWIAGAPDDVPPSDGLMSSPSGKYEALTSRRKTARFKSMTSRGPSAGSKRGLLEGLFSLACCSKR